VVREKDYAEYGEREEPEERVAEEESELENGLAGIGVGERDSRGRVAHTKM